MKDLFRVTESFESYRGGASCVVGVHRGLDWKTAVRLAADIELNAAIAHIDLDDEGYVPSGIDDPVFVAWSEKRERLLPFLRLMDHLVILRVNRLYALEPVQ